jgi:hypothetical protein
MIGERVSRRSRECHSAPEPMIPPQEDALSTETTWSEAHWFVGISLANMKLECTKAVGTTL